MRRNLAMAVLALAAPAVATLAPRAARAGCDAVVVARIAFPPGDYCWSYAGTATVFIGGLGRGQQVTVRMRGEEADYDPKTGRTTSSMQPRFPEVTGPENFSTVGDAGKLAFTTPRAGAYRFSFSPCAMWGGRGTVEICAR